MILDNYEVPAKDYTYIMISDKSIKENDSRYSGKLLNFISSLSSSLKKLAYGEDNNDNASIAYS